LACPFFEPALDPPPEPWRQRWTHRPRLPLGDCYSGACHAADGQARWVTEAERELCNQGYARGRCEHFPAACAADAVRSSVTGETSLGLVYILEKDHAPLEHGEIDPASLPPEQPMLAAQARAFIASLRRVRDAQA
jgi:hypothetical protein